MGKVGDIVWIQGKHFGTNPDNKQLVIGGKVVADTDIAAWDDSLIQAVIPPGAAQGGIVEVRIGNHPVSKSLPYVMYDNSSKVKLHKQGNLITADNAEGVVKAMIWTGDDEIPTEEAEQGITYRAGTPTPIFNTRGLPLLTILLLDARGEVVPYHVDPVEFDF